MVRIVMQQAWGKKVRTFGVHGVHDVHGKDFGCLRGCEEDGAPRQPPFSAQAGELGDEEGVVVPCRRPK